MSFVLVSRLTTTDSSMSNRPRSLNLPSHDEITAMEHLDLLRLNGFEVLVDEDADVGERVKLLAQPVSKDTVFGVEGESMPQKMSSAHLTLLSLRRL